MAILTIMGLLLTFIPYAALAAAPGNDNFPGQEIYGLSGSETGSNVDATQETGEPPMSFTVNSVWWSWTPMLSGTIEFDTFGSNFDTYLCVYTGNDISALTLVAQNDDTSCLQSKVVFDVIEGTTCHIAVDGYGTNQGSINLQWSPESLFENIDVDIKPADEPNSVNAFSSGVFAVAIMGQADFDVTNIDVASIRLHEVVEPFRGDIKDVGTFGEPALGPDGINDLVLLFDTQEVIGAIGDVYLKDELRR